MKKVRFLRSLRVAVDDVGYVMADASPGDVAELPDYHARSLVGGRFAEFADEAALPTLTREGCERAMQAAKEQAAIRSREVEHRITSPARNPLAF